MLYELRVYRCMPRRKSDVLAMFREDVVRLFARHGIEIVGFWDTVVGDVDDVLYICRFASWEDLQTRWAAFRADPEWHRVRDTRGAIVEHIRTSLLTATDFSPHV